MELTGERRIPAPRDRVWQALNDPLVLQASIPGCETLERLSDTELKGMVATRIGPVSARFTGRVTFTDIDPPNGCRLAGEGQGGVAGFAKGSALLHLAEDGGETVLTYAVTAQVGGKLAQLGARLIDATARQMAEAFFTRFADLLAAPVAEAPVAEAAPAAPPPGPIARRKLNLRIAVWAAVVLCLVLLASALLFGSSR